MVVGHSMGPGLQLVGARFLNFHLGKLSREFKLRPISIFDEIQMAIFRHCGSLKVVLIDTLFTTSHYWLA